MRVAHAAVLLLLLTAGCARVKPDTAGLEAEAVATQLGAPQPAAKPTGTGDTATQACRGTPPGAKTSAAAPALDLTALTEELKATKAIGFFTKITLKNRVDDCWTSSASTSRAGRSSP